MADKKTATMKATSTEKVSANRANRTPAKKSVAKKTMSAEKKMSALDAAAKLLAETKEPTTSKTLIEAMAAKGYWNSPGGQTPQATLQSRSKLPRIAKKGNASRVLKTDRVLFSPNA